MKFSIDCEIFKKVIKKISTLSVVSYNQFLWNMNTVLITAHEKKLTLNYRNEYIQTKIELGPEDGLVVTEVGEILIKGKMLSDIVSRMKGEWIKFTQVETNLVVVKNINSEYELNLLDSTKFQKIDFNIEVQDETKLNSDIFKNSAEKVMFAISDKQPRKIFHGVNFKMHSGKLTLIATDGVKVAINTVPVNSNKETSKVISSKSLKEIFKLVEANEEMKMQFSNDYLLIGMKDLLIKANLIEGKFPDVENFFPKTFSNTLSISKNELNDVLDRVMILHEQKATENLSVKISIKKEELKIEARELEIGYAFASTKEFMWSGTEIFAISFNPLFLKETLREIEEEVVVVQFNDFDNPFQVQNVKNNNFKCLILPLKIN